LKICCFGKLVLINWSLTSLLFIREAINLYRENKMEPLMIYEHYIVETGPFVINISHKNRGEIHRIFRKYQDNKPSRKTVVAELITSARNSLMSSKSSVTGTEGGGGEPLLEITSRTTGTGTSGAVSLSAFEDASKTVFDKCQKEVFFLMACDSFMRFCRTPQFEKFWRANVESFDEFMEKHRNDSQRNTQQQQLLESSILFEEAKQ
jgi:hypothetical protein